MKTTAILLLSYFLISCSTLTQSLVPITSVERVDIEQNEYIRPQVYLDDFEFSKNSRSIASVVDESEFRRLSNRQLYFLSFYKQYLNLGELLGKKSEIKNCPSFHNTLLEHEKLLKSSVKGLNPNIDLKIVENNSRMASKFPALAIPYSQNADLYTHLVAKDWQESNKHMQKALNHYYEIETKEIMTLCETGISPGYYVYENLVNYFKNDKSFHRTQEGLKALLKVPVIANMIILDNFKIDNYPIIRDNNDFDRWLIERSNLSWFEEYRQNITQSRKKQLSANY